MKHFPYLSSRSVAPRAAALGLGAGVVLAGLVAPVARAATSDSQTSNFCSQIRSSQSAIASVTGTGQAKNKRIAQEWSKIERVAPATLKTPVTAIRTAYEKAATQSDTAAAATLKTFTAQAKAVTTFISANCSQTTEGRPGRAPVDEAAMAKATACMAKEGFTIPTRFENEGGAPAQPAGKARFDPSDPKFQAAAEKCGFTLGGRRGGDGGGGLEVTPAMQACLKSKGLAWPPVATGVTSTTKKGTATTNKGTATTKKDTATTEKGSVTNNSNGTSGAPGAPGGSFRGMDDKTRAAFEACRAQTQSTTTKKG